MTLNVSPALTNLVRIGRLKPEPPDDREVAGLLRSAEARLLDAKRERSENFYLVFQCLEHTVGFHHGQSLLLDQAHKKRNLAEYEGDLDATDQFVAELTDQVTLLIAAVKTLATP